MRLILIRHGRASGIDDTAELTPAGRNEVASTGEGLAGIGLARSTRVLHSGVRRAAQTAAELTRHLPLQTPTADPRLRSEADPDVALRAIGELNDDTIIVTHQPLVSRLASLLDSDCTARFDTATAAVFRRDGERWVFESVVEPLR